MQSLVEARSLTPALAGLAADRTVEESVNLRDITCIAQDRGISRSGFGPVVRRLDPHSQAGV